MLPKYEELELSSLLTSDGYVVAIEGDESLYDDDLDEWLKNNVKNYILLNNIYDNPEKLFQLKNIKIDVFIFQTTGLNPKLKTLIDLYIEKIGNYPHNFVTVFRDGECFFDKIFKQLDSYEVFRYEEVDGDKMYIQRQDHSCKNINRN